MRAVKFDQANIDLAENQDEYETLPICMDVDENRKVVMVLESDSIGAPMKMVPRDKEGHAIMCFELNKEEIDEINATGKIYLTQLTFWNPFQPIGMTTQNPFKH